ncbi:2Fe-2S iron-sulfur cluster binding domain-containing protein [Massilia arenosa]|uniref:2Fe-2S iron-sulfur cluster binding domain-containing protein n=1 Tax=Zemynaea arenosa TaxID=2561931 RepID=A0A4Y9SMZ1_9BURK|nr:2Fe-2S iron-sulfur cluster-binding protein [Massilia arenosa]TFW27811.1 2Fe-2S iron-sulfur cluster binding domain-containing protein [Massilia arenosa]
MATYRITFARSGASIEAPDDLPVLLAAERAGYVMASSCRNGTCRTCLRQLSAGAVGYRIEWPGLSADEKRDGWFLPCVAYPRSDLTIA